MNWEDFDYWNTGEWQVVEERLRDHPNNFCPSFKHLFDAMDATPYAATRVAIIGQDPYPSRNLATGIAFDIPANEKAYPPTLFNILKEYCDDLHYTLPTNGSLVPWTKQGVFLWNAIPSCEVGKSLSHAWDEWTYLTKEIVQRLSHEGTVLAFLGGVARQYVQYVDQSKSKVIETSHPSPRGSRTSNIPFLGSRLFSTINIKLKELGREPIDWRLPGSLTQQK